MKPLCPNCKTSDNVNGHIVTINNFKNERKTEYHYECDACYSKWQEEITECLSVKELKKLKPGTLILNQVYGKGIVLRSEKDYKDGRIAIFKCQDQKVEINESYPWVYPTTIISPKDF